MICTCRHRTLAFVIICLCVSFNSRAQLTDIFSEDDHRTFYGGLTAGGNFSTVDGDSYGGYKKAGWVVGGTVYAKLFSDFFANIELLYTQKGSKGIAQKTSIYTGEFFEQFWLDLNYVEIPLIIHCKIPARFNMHGGIGVSYARLLNSNEEIYTDQPIVIDQSEAKFNEEDINFVINYGLQVANRWFVNLRYQRSVSTIRDAENIPVWQASIRQYNDLFSIRLLFLIGN